MSTRETIVVVGSGIAGLATALALKDEFDIVLVERDKAFGGLLRTYRNPAGVPFDYGTHVLGETGDAEVDALIFGRVRDGAWNRFKIVRAGTYFRGKLSPQSPHIDVRTFEPADYRRAVEELMATPANPPEPKNLEEQLRSRFGPTVTELAQAPSLRKIFNCELKDLQPGNPFALRRFIAFDAAESRRLKAEPRLDNVLAYNSYDEGVGETVYYYPKKGSMGQITEDICRELKESGARLLSGRSVTGVELADKRVRGVTLDDGTKIACSRVVWTVPPFLLLKALGIPSPSAAPQAMPTGLFYYHFDRPFLCDNYYTTNYDPKFKLFRVTMFPNLRGRPDEGPFNCTVEAIGAGAAPDQEPEIRRELVEMGMISADAKVISVDHERLAAGFPAMTHAFIAAAGKQAELARSASPDIVMVGRAKFDMFSTESIMREGVATAKRLIAEKDLV